MAPALVTAAWKSPPRRSAPSVALREFRLQGLDWLQDEGVDATQRGEIQAHVVSEEQGPVHAAHEGGSLVGDLFDLRLAGHEPHRDVELTTDVRRLIAVPQEDCSMGAGARVFHPADEFVVVRFGERGSKREDLRVLVQLGLPSPGDRDERRGRVHDGDHGPDSERQGLRPVRSDTALRAESGPEGLQMRDGFLELVVQGPQGPDAADPREDAEEVAERPARGKSRRNREGVHLVAAGEITERAAGRDRDDATTQLDPLRGRGEGLFRVAGIGDRNEKIIGPRVGRKPIIPNHLDGDLGPVRKPAANASPPMAEPPMPTMKIRWASSIGTGAAPPAFIPVDSCSGSEAMMSRIPPGSRAATLRASNILDAIHGDEIRTPFRQSSYQQNSSYNNLDIRPSGRRTVDPERALASLRRGEFVLVYDGDGREAETDLTIASEFVTPAGIRTPRKEAGGLICMTVSGEG